ncbi:MAG: hypothetical protein DWQ34_08910 [Planctomycetota bacterium]|nr:MAG: hypothetical protein DWQ34_08910 [Planctomycetota bacterium]REK20172.1 MAG: hypothetical protein DWQ41_25850 [Planctomycetota bacterium]REK35373.1 MAG: hypothetical protein DWQ45_11670 [Planctomycetota bacterium]
MAGPIVVRVDPRALHLPTTRPEGADPAKLQRQIARFGRSSDGMPEIQETRGSDGHFMINDGVTRATRIAKLAPGDDVPAIIIAQSRHPVGMLRTIQEKLP